MLLTSWKNQERAAHRIAWSAYLHATSVELRGIEASWRCRVTRFSHKTRYQLCHLSFYECLDLGSGWYCGKGAVKMDVESRKEAKESCDKNAAGSSGGKIANCSMDWRDARMCFGLNLAVSLNFFLTEIAWIKLSTRYHFVFDCGVLVELSRSPY